MNDFGNTTFCRLCLNVTEIQQTADLAGDKQICTILENVFPGMKLDLVQTPKICLTCRKKLQFAYVFKNTVLSNEQKIISNQGSFVIASDMCRLCLKGKLGEHFVYLYENNQSSYSYQLIRTVTEIATAPLKFDMFEKTIMCTECWSTVKEISSFKKRCFDNEEKLRNLYKNTNNGLNSLSIEEVLTAVILKEQAASPTTNKENNTLNTVSEVNLGSDKEDIVSQDMKNVQTYSIENDRVLISDSDFDNDLPDSNNKNEHSGSEINEDISDETLNDGVEMRMKNRKYVEDTKLNDVNLNNHDSIIDVDTSENHHCSAELVKEEQEISIEEHDISHDDFAGFKEESVWETSLLTPSSHSSIKAKTTKQHTSSYSSNPSKKIDKSLSIRLIDCVKYQANLSITNIGTETGQISHSHTELRANNRPKRTIKCGECEYVTSSKEVMTRHMEKHILYSDTENKCPNCQKVYRNPDILEDHIKSCGGGRSGEKLSGKKLNKTTQRMIFKRHKLLHVNKEKCDDIETTDNIKPNKTTGCAHKNTEAGTPRSNLEAIKAFDKVVYECNNSNCSYKTTFHSEFVFHLKSLHNREFICDICQKGYHTSRYLRIHRLTHCENGKFVCDLCPKTFNRMYFLNRHRKIHRDRSYICNICKNTFKTNEYLKSHRLKHVEKNFICYTCQRSFTTKFLIRKHQLTHIADKNYICDSCRKPYKTNGHLHVYRLRRCKDCRFI